jgi:hypothetical protein
MGVDADNRAQDVGKTPMASALSKASPHVRIGGFHSRDQKICAFSGLGDRLEWTAIMGNPARAVIG